MIHGEGQNPGAGGWPTIRYFNKNTGYGGKAYEKRTSMAMCSELGPEGTPMMQEYVENAGTTSLCSVVTKKGCSEKEGLYIDKMKAKSAADVEKQVKRLSKMKDKKMKPDLAKWVSQRLKILQGLQKASSKDEL